MLLRLLSRELSEQKIQQQTDLSHQDHRNTNGKFQVLRFVPYQVHGSQHTDAAAHKGKTHQHPLRNPPQILFCEEFVRGHNHKSCGIDNKEVGQKYFQNKTLSGGMV